MSTEKTTTKPRIDEADARALSAVMDDLTLFGPRGGVDASTMPATHDALLRIGNLSAALEGALVTRAACPGCGKTVSLRLRWDDRRWEARCPECGEEMESETMDGIAARDLEKRPAPPRIPLATIESMESVALYNDPAAYGDVVKRRRLARENDCAVAERLAMAIGGLDRSSIHLMADLAKQMDRELADRLSQPQWGPLL